MPAVVRSGPTIRLSLLTYGNNIGDGRNPISCWAGPLDSFDFTIFLLIMLPIAQEFNVPLTDVTFVFTITLWMRLVGAVSSGWLGDRLGRRRR